MENQYKFDVYAYQRLVGKIDDSPELKTEFITVYDTKSHKDVVRFCLAYGQSLLDLMGLSPFDEVVRAFEAMQEWIDGKVGYQKARNIAGEFNDLAREEKDIVKVRFYRTMAQIAASPHVKYHGLWATDFAVTLVNRMYPADMSAVKKEREKQIELLKMI